MITAKWRLSLSLLAVVVVVVAVAIAVLIKGTPGSRLAGDGETSQASPAITAGSIPQPRTTVNPKLAPGLPAGGAYFGAYVQPPQFTQPEDVAAVTGLQHTLGRKLDIVHSYLRWNVPFPTASQREFLNSGHKLLLSWAGTDTRTIAAGLDDSWIRRQAAAIKAAGKPIFLEWRWEMNRPGMGGQVHSPANYIAAWDHIREVFRKQHVHNVAWVWCPSSKGFTGPTKYRNPAAFYPGNSEVDWVCADVYPPTGARYAFTSLVSPFLNWAIRTGKPIMIGEYGVPRSYGSSRAAWLRTASQVIRKDPQIKAVVYYDGDLGGTAQHNYGLTGQLSALAAIRDMARLPYFNPRQRD